MAQAEPRSTPKSPSPRAKSHAVPKNISPAKTNGAAKADDFLRHYDPLSLKLREACGIVDSVRGSCFGEILNEESHGHALTVAVDYLEECSERLTRFYDHWRAQNKRDGAVS